MTFVVLLLSRQHTLPLFYLVTAETVAGKTQGALAGTHPNFNMWLISEIWRVLFWLKFELRTWRQTHSDRISQQGKGYTVTGTCLLGGWRPPLSPLHYVTLTRSILFQQHNFFLELSDNRADFSFIVCWNKDFEKQPTRTHIMETMNENLGRIFSMSPVCV